MQVVFCGCFKLLVYGTYVRDWLVAEMHIIAKCSHPLWRETRHPIFYEVAVYQKLTPCEKAIVGFSYNRTRKNRLILKGK